LLLSVLEGGSRAFFQEERRLQLKKKFLHSRSGPPVLEKRCCFDQRGSSSNRGAVKGSFKKTHRGRGGPSLLLKTSIADGIQGGTEIHSQLAR